MLVLSRRRGEKLTIGPDIVITVTSIESGKVRLGIEAPREVLVLRLPEHADAYEKLAELHN